MGQGKITKDQIAEKDVFGNIEKSSAAAEAQVKSLEIALKSVVEIAKKVKSTATGEDPSNNNTIRERNELLKKAETLVKAKVNTEKKLQRARLAELKLQKDREKAYDRYEKQLIRQNKEQEKAAKIAEDNANAYKNLTKETNAAQAEFKRLAVEFGVNSKEAQKANIKFAQLDNRLRGINKAAKDGRRDVGRYGIALREVGVSLKYLFLAGGIVGAIRGIGRAFGDAFERIRSFDKELQNIAGITGTSRKDLKSLEKAIISVAGSSIKTSNEVAQLASTLFTLGNSEKEVKLLLKPVNDLSIALGATSEESADFLGQTLNAFGKGAESGQEFADIIANVRTSTSLDFQRIKDALGFVAPTANALGLSLGQVSAQIGVLQDNGIKSARAGRLLNTSFARLVKQGKTLDEALKEINESQDKVATATNLFGAESFTLGLILADNVEKTAELANEFDNLSDGSLESLTNEQLESLDSKLKIVDSSWEKLIFSIEKGDGRIGRAIKSSLDALSKFLNFVADGEKTRTQIVDEEGDKRAAKLITDVQREAKTEEERVQNLKNLRSQALKNLRGFNADVGKAQRQLFNELNKVSDITGNKGLNKSITEISEAFNKDVLGLRAKQFDTGLNSVKNLVEGFEDLGNANTKVSLAVVNRVKEEKLLAAIELELNKEVEINTEVTEGNSTAKSTNAKSTRELTGLIEKQAKVVSDLNTQIKEAKTEEDILNLSKQNDIAKKELERLKRIVSSSIEEINKIELDLMDESIEKRIAKEKVKSDKIIKAIETNSRITEDRRNDLIVQENERLLDFELDQLIKANQKRIKTESEFAKAEFEQERTGFKSEEDFKKEKEARFKAIRLKAINDELKVLETAGREKDKLRIAELKAERESLAEFQKQREYDGELTEKALQFTEQLITKSIDKRISLQQKEEEARRSNLDEFKQAARDGNITAKESLAEEERLAEEAQVKQQKLEQKKQNVLLVSAILQAFNSELATGKTAGQALAGAITSTTVLTQFASALPAFIDGTEMVSESLGKPQLSGQDGHIIRVDGKERIMNPDQNKRIGNFTNEEVAQTMEQKRLGNLAGDTQMIAVANGVDLSSMEVKLEEVRRAIIDKPEQKIELGAITQKSFEIRESVKKGNRTTTNVFKVK